MIEGLVKEGLVKEEIMFRELNSNDLFLTSSIVDAMDIDLTKINFESGDNNKIGMAMIYAIFRNLHNAKKEVNLFLASLTGLKVNEIEKMSLLEYKKLINKLKKLDGLMELFKQAD